MAQPDELAENQPVPGAVDEAELSSAVAGTDRRRASSEDRRRLLGPAGRASDPRAGRQRPVQAKAAISWIADTVVDVAPHIPVRDLDTLRRHFPGLDGDALAERLVRNAARATAGDRRRRRRRGRGRVGRDAEPCSPPRCCWPPRRSPWWRWR